MSDTFDENPSTLEENVLALMRTIKGPGQASETEQKLSCALDKLSETQRLLDLREQQLADCTRAMREVSAVLRSWGSGETWCCLADRLDAARAGKAGA